MAYPDLTWPRYGNLSVNSISAEEEKIIWFIEGMSLERNYIKSDEFSFAGAKWNFFAQFSQGSLYHFGVNVRTQNSSEAEFDYYCNISFLKLSDELIKNIDCNLKCGKADTHWDVTNFLSSYKQQMSAYFEIKIVFRISKKKLNNKESCSQTEISSFTQSSAVDAHTQTQLIENKDEEILKSNPIYKVCQDLKQMLLSEEDSDVTFQIGDQQFKAHRSILKVRSSVFAAMFRHDMKEKATGVVNAEDCEPSSFPVLLEFLYCGSTEKLSVENVFCLYTSADKYNVQDLKTKCLEFIKNNISVETFCETVKLGLQHLETNLLKISVDFFAGNFKKIIKTPKWQAFILENPIQGNEILIKALASDVDDL